METVSIATPKGVFRASAAGPGDGPVVLLLHGFPQSRHTWREMLPALAESGYRAVAPDQRGYSPGARPSEISAYTAGLLTKDVVDLADALGAERFDVVGHDFGGHFAWLTAAHHGDRVRSLAVLSRPHPTAFRKSFELDPEQNARSSHHSRFASPEATAELARDDFAALRAGLIYTGVPEADVDAYLSVLREPGALDAALNWYRAARQSQGLRLENCPDIRVPTLYLWGSHDSSVGRVAAELTAEHVKAPYTFIELPGSGHFLTDDGGGPAATKALLEHLARTRAQRSRPDR